MDGNGFLSAPLRGPGGPVPISIPLTALRSSPAAVSLTAPRPETERRDNEYVDAPLRGPLAPSSPLSTHRPPAPAPPQVPPIDKQPVSFSKMAASASSCGTSRTNIMCNTCGQCKCDTCRTPKPLPECWACKGSCRVSADTIIDYASCMCCVKGFVYHCCDTDDADSSCADDPWGCGPHRRAARWGCMTALSLPIPLLLLYWPLRGVKRAVELCYERHSRSGCRCRPPKQPPRPPAKRLLGNDSLQDF